ncbi:MAG: hypothetical protein KY459_04240 [Acidobacteria bacterium]|nr:hypothetical protein [Acidobacteriota bacterium]
MSRPPQSWDTTIRRRSKDVAHDIKTPINIAVLNLELLRMSLLREPDPDQKRLEHCASAERELRRIAQIMDALFSLLGVEHDESESRVSPIISEVARELGISLKVSRESSNEFKARVPEAVLRKLAENVLSGGGDALEGAEATFEAEQEQFRLTIRGAPRDSAEIGKIFKFYYTDASQKPRLELATARLMAEAFGGSLQMEHAEDETAFILEMPGRAE